MAERYVDSGGASIWTTSQGNGIPLLLCNGGPGCCDYLGPVAAMIEDLAYVIRFEQRGCGRSDVVGPYDVQTCLDDIEIIREDYGIHQWIVGGHSWGPNLAIAYAVEFPERVLGVLGISGGVIHKDKAWSDQYNRRSKAGEECVPDFDYPPNMEVNKAVNTSWREYVRKPDLLRRIANSQVPSIFVFGGSDIRPSWPVEQLASLMPRGSFVSIPGASHAIWLTHDGELRSHIREFIRLVTATR